MSVVPPSADSRIWTVAELEQLPDGLGRFELLHGELIPMTPGSFDHNGLALALAEQLRAWARRTARWTVRAPAGVYINETTWLEPDVAVYPVAASRGTRWQELPPPALAVEVTSPSTARHDRHRQRPEYLRRGVREVWLIDPETLVVERWVGGSEFPEVVRGQITWSPLALEPFTVELAALIAAGP